MNNRSDIRFSSYESQPKPVAPGSRSSLGHLTKKFGTVLLAAAGIGWLAGGESSKEVTDARAEMSAHIPVDLESVTPGTSILNRPFFLQIKTPEGKQTIQCMLRQHDSLLTLEMQGPDGESHQLVLPSYAKTPMGMEYLKDMERQVIGVTMEENEVIRFHLSPYHYFEVIRWKEVIETLVASEIDVTYPLVRCRYLPGGAMFGSFINGDKEFVPYTCPVERVLEINESQ